MAALLCSVAIWAGPDCRAQDDGPDVMKLINRVNELESMLSAESLVQREEAEQELVALGPAALDYLGVAEDGQTSDLRERLQRIRTALETAAVEAVSSPSQLRLSGEFTVDAILSAVREQTGNQIGLANGTPARVGEQRLSVDWQGTEFWEVVENLRRRAGLAMDPYLSRPGELTLVPAGGGGDGESAAAILPCRTTASVLLIEVARADVTRNFANPQTSGTGLQLRVCWEPRLRPIRLRLPLSSITVVDDRGNTVPLAKPEEVASALIQPEILQSEFHLRLPLMDREVVSIRSLEGTIDMLVPGRVETFEFPGVALSTPGLAQTRAGATVTYEGTRKNGDLHEVRISLSFVNPDEGMESHLVWAHGNEVWLRRSDGSRLQPLASETWQQAEYLLGMTYLFESLPEDADLVYRTPAAIVRLPVKFSLNGIPLP